jgi:hypothetical protein
VVITLKLLSGNLAIQSKRCYNIYMSIEHQEVAAQERLNFVVQQSLDHVVAYFGGQAQIFDTGIEVEVCRSEELQDRFPALVRPGDPNKLFFEETQYSRLISDISERYKVTPESVARLYIGCGMTTTVLENGISPMQPAQVDKLYTVLSDTDELTSAINCVDELFGDEERFMATLNVMTSNESRVCRINALRFAVGTFFMAEAHQGNPDYGDLMTKSFRETLNEKLAKRENYIKLFKALGNTREQAEYSFADKISLVELAVCFPMSEAEIKVITDIANYEDNRIYRQAQDTVVLQSEFTGKNGFYDPVAQETRTFGLRE